MGGATLLICRRQIPQVHNLHVHHLSEIGFEKRAMSGPYGHQHSLPRMQGGGSTHMRNDIQIPDLPQSYLSAVVAARQVRAKENIPLRLHIRRRVFV